MELELLQKFEKEGKFTITLDSVIIDIEEEN